MTTILRVCIDTRIFNEDSYTYLPKPRLAVPYGNLS